MSKRTGADGVTWRETIGRDAQRQSVLAAIEAGETVVVTGNPGVGKSAFLDALAAELRSFADVVHVRATESSRKVPLGVFVGVLAASPARGAPVQGMRDVLLAIANRAEARQVVLVIDDVQHLDDASVTVVQQLVLDLVARVVLAYRIGEELPGGIDELRSWGGTCELTLGPLAPEQATAVVTSLAHGDLSPDVVDDICRQADGLPLFLVTLTRDRLEVRGDRPPVVGRSLRAAVRGRLGRLTEAERRALEIVALADPLELEVAEELATTAVLESLERRGLLEIDDARGRTVVRLQHPLFGEVLRAEPGGLDRRRLLRQLVAASRVDDPDPARLLRTVLWVLDAGDAVEPVQLVAAAEVAAGLGGADVSERLARLAWRNQPTDATACLLANALLGAGKIAEVDELCATLPTPVDESHRIQIATTWSVAAFAGLGDAARAAAIIERFRPLVGDVARDELDVIDIMIRFYSGHVASAVEVGERVLAVDGLAARARTLALLPHVLALATAGRTSDAVALATEAVRRAPAHAAEIPAAETQALCVWGYASAWHGEPRVCETELDRHAREARLVLDHAAAEVLEVTLGIARMVEGQYASAAELFAQLRPSANLFSLSWMPYAQAWRAQCLARAGRIDEARAAALPGAIGGRDAAHHGFLALALAEIDVSAGAVDAAVARLDAAAGAAETHAQVLVALLCRFRALTLAPAAGRAGAVLGLTARHDGRLAAGMAEATEAWLRRDPSAIARIADSVAGAGLGTLALDTWDLALATVAAGGTAATERERLQRGRERSRRGLGAGLAGEPGATVSVTLTGRELDIARLAADGLQDKAIADKLLVSVRTVQAHLRSVYTKLGIHHRAALRGHPALPGDVDGAGGPTG